MKGQSLIEVLIAIGVGVFLFAAAVALIQPALKQNTQIAQVQMKATIAGELMNNIQVWAAGNWNSLVALSTTSANHYYLNTSSSPFSAVSTSTGESLNRNGRTYVRYFYVSDIYRDSNNLTTTTASGNSADPSTKGITVIANTNPADTGASTTVQVYLTRTVSNVVAQSDWSGGSGQGGPSGLLGSGYAAGSNVNTGTSSSIQISPQ